MSVTYAIFQPQLATPELTNYNCDCDDDWPTATLLELQRRILVRLGFAAMPSPPPGMAELVNDFLASSQRQLYQKYRSMRTPRWFTWQLTEGQRFYDIAANIDTCLKKMDPRKVLWIGISRGDNVWTKLIEGIDPIMYTSKILAIPCYFEIRQCIELWPAPSDNTWLMRIKADFGLLDFSTDGDLTTVDSEAVFLDALANAKAHYGQPDAANIKAEANAYIAALNAGRHPTKRLWPGASPIPNAIPPLMANNPGTN